MDSIRLDKRSSAPNTNINIISGPRNSIANVSSLDNSIVQTYTVFTQIRQRIFTTITGIKLKGFSGSNKIDSFDLFFKILIFFLSFSLSLSLFFL